MYFDKSMDKTKCHRTITKDNWYER